MANSRTLFLERNKVPSRQALQEAVKGLKFRLGIDDAYVPFECSGYIPCTLDGEDAGFEIRFGVCPESLSPSLQGRDVSMVLRWGGDPRERTSALMISAALAHAFGALVNGEREEDFLSADQLIEEARAAFSRL